MKWLLDGNVLVALSLEQHAHHRRCHDWISGEIERGARLATCPVTEGTLLRIHMQRAEVKTGSAAREVLESMRRLPNHELWLNNFSFSEIPLDPLQSHRQVTEAWLVELARRRGGKLATLDASVATLHPDDAFLIPVLPSDC